MNLEFLQEEKYFSSVLVMDSLRNGAWLRCVRTLIFCLMFNLKDKTFVLNHMMEIAHYDF